MLIHGDIHDVTQVQDAAGQHHSQGEIGGLPGRHAIEDHSHGPGSSLLVLDLPENEALHEELNLLPGEFSLIAFLDDDIDRAHLRLRAAYSIRFGIAG